MAVLRMTSYLHQNSLSTEQVSFLNSTTFRWCKSKLLNCQLLRYKLFIAIEMETKKNVSGPMVTTTLTVDRKVVSLSCARIASNKKTVPIPKILVCMYDFL